MTEQKRIGVAIDKVPAPTETFIQAQLDFLPTDSPVWIVRPDLVGRLGGPNLLDLGGQLAGKVRLALRQGLGSRALSILQREFESEGITTLLGQYGTTSSDCLPAARRARIALAAHFHGYDASRSDILERYGQLYRYLFSYASAVIAVSVSMKEKLRTLGAPEYHLHLIPYGTRLDVPTAVPSRNSPHLVFIGRLVEKKDPLGLIEVFRRVASRFPEARLTMVGEGPLRKACEARLATYGLGRKVTITGLLPNDAAMELLAQARIYIQHSRTARDGNAEGLPLAILEAMARGLPVVSTLHAGIPDAVVDAKTGFLLPEGDYQGMAERIIHMLLHPSVGDTLGEQGRRRCEALFDIRNRSSELHKLLLDLPRPAADS